MEFRNGPSDSIEIYPPISEQTKTVPPWAVILLFPPPNDQIDLKADLPTFLKEDSVLFQQTLFVIVNNAESCPQNLLDEFCALDSQYTRSTLEDYTMPSNVTFVQTLSASLLLTFVTGSSTLAKVTCIASSPEPLLAKLLERLPECAKHAFETLHDLTSEEIFGNTSRLLPFAQPHWELLELVLHNILINLRDVEAFNLDRHIAQVVARTSDDNRLLLTQMALYELMANNLVRSTGHNEVQYSFLFKQACFGLFETQEDMGGHDPLCTFNWAAVKQL